MFTKKIIFILSFCLLLGFEAHSQVDLKAFELSGKVVDEKGKGIAKVAVTNGINITQTDTKGEYKLLCNSTCEYIYLSIPSGYEIPVDNKVPCFYQQIDKQKKRKYDFTLKKLTKSDDKHAMIVWADPQVNFADELPIVQKAADDVVKLVKEKYPDIPVYGILCGDIIHDTGKEPRFYEPIKETLHGTGLPFFYAVGNHDIVLDVRSDVYSKELFKQHFGPTYYSFNRGKIHYIVLDDVFYAGNSYYYIGYLPEQQLNWLQQDLALVPEGSTVVVSMHIPGYSVEARRGEYGKEPMTKVLHNRQVLYKMLAPYNAHIFSGHEHQNENYIVNGIYEHNHAALCGLFWQAPWCQDGTPSGYAVYEFDGDKMGWYFQTLEYGAQQFRAYPAGSSKEKPDAIIANVWNYDPEWKIYWYEDGIRKGEMQQFSGYDPLIRDYVEKHRKDFKYNWISVKPTDHLFFAVPENQKSKIEIEVVDRFGNIYKEDIK